MRSRPHPTQASRRRRRRCVVFSKVFHFSMPSLLLALQALLRCASWPAMDKRAQQSQGTSGGARAAGMEQGERAERRPGKGPCSVLWWKAKNPQRALLTHTGGRKPSSPHLQGTRGHLGGAEAAGRNVGQRDWRSTGECCCSVLQRKAENRQGAVPVCPGGKFLPEPRAGDPSTLP